MLIVHPHDIKPADLSTVLLTNGLGRLTYCTEANLNQKINGDWCLRLTYPMDMPGAGLLLPDRVIACEGQLYRILRSNPRDTRKGRFTSIEAPHIAYDLDNYNIVNIETKEDDRYPEGINARQALEQILEGTPFSVGTVDVDLSVLDYLDILQKSPFWAIKQQLLPQWGGELVFDNWTIHLRAQMGTDRRYPIRAQRNIDEINFTEAIDNLVTRLHVRGYNNANFEDIKEGKDYIYSEYIALYSHIHEGYIDFPDIDDPEELLRLGREHLEKVQIPNITYDVKLAPLESSQEYAVYKQLEQYGLGDTAALHHDYLDNDILVRAVDRTRDVLRGVNTRAVLGNPQEDIISTISAGKIANDILAGLVRQDGYLRAEMLAGPIDLIKVNNLSAEMIRAVAAEIEKLVASEADIYNLKANIAEIVEAHITELFAGQVTTNQLYAAVAEVINGSIGNADIGFAQIKDLVADQAIITQGVGGQLYINRLVVNEANMVSLTTGKMIVKGDDGQFYRITVDDQGNVIPIVDHVEGDNIADKTIGGSKIIENSITTTELNAAQIFADEAFMVKLFAGMGTFGSLFAESAVIPYLQTAIIESNALLIKVQEAFAESDDLRDMQASIAANVDAITATVNRTTNIERQMDGLATENYVQNSVSQVRQTAQDLTVRLTTTESALGNLDNLANQLNNVVATYQTIFTLASIGLIISNGPGTGSLLCAPDRIALRDPSNAEVLYASQSKLYAPNIEVTETLKVGKLVFQVSSNRTTIKWGA